MSFKFYVPTNLIFGSGSLDSLAQHKLPGKKALIVTGGTSVKKFGYLNKLTAQLKIAEVSYEIFDKVLPNPISAHVEEAAKLAVRTGCDFIVGIGGGSSIDSAKSIAVMATNDGHYWDYIHGGSGKAQPLKKKPLPVVAIPTTAGTGTEIDPWTVITNSGEKIGFGNDDTFPFLSIFDPTLTLTVPPHLTAYQGFDTLCHATEAYINKYSNRMSDMFCEKAITLVAKNLPLCVANGNDIEARENVAFACTLAGFTESLSGCTSCHSIEHALSAASPTLEHGAGLISVSLEYYRYFVESGELDERFTTLAKWLGKTDTSKPEDFLTAWEQLIKACKVDNIKLSDYGINKDDLKSIAESAFETMGGLFECDRAELDYKNVCKILERSYK